MKKFVQVVLVCVAVCGTVLTGCSKKNTDAVKDSSLEDLKNRGVFILGLDDSFPPLGFRDENNEIVGYDIDLAKEVAKRLGVNFKAQPIEWDAKEQELNTGKIDCIWNGFTITPERQEALAFTVPYLKNEQVVVVRRDSNIKTLADMAGKTIGLQGGSSAQEAVDGNASFAESLKNQVIFNDNVTALNDLEVGGVDGVVMDSVVADYGIATTGKSFTVLPDALAKEEYGVAFRKTDIALRDAVQKILNDMQKDGTIENISTKWFGRNISVIGQ